MTAILAQIIEILIAGITGIASGVGSGLTTLAQSIFLGSEPGSLSVFGGLVIVSVSYTHLTLPTISRV